MKKAFKDIPNLKREDVFITSKLWNSQHRPEHVESALDDCLQELELEYLDLYLMHFPLAFDSKKPNTELFPLMENGDVQMLDSVSIVDTWKAMTKLSKSKARAVGVSNCSINHLQAMVDSGVTPAANQVERHALLPQPELVKFCKEKNIHITAYSAFGNNMLDKPLLISYPEVKEIADRLKATPAQVMYVPHLFRFLIRPRRLMNVIYSLAWSQVGEHSVIPKSVTPARIASNFEEIDLPEKDFEAVSELGKKNPARYNIPYIASK